MGSSDTMPKFYDRFWSDKKGKLGDFALKWPKLSRYIPRGDAVILDFGCGNGEIIKEMMLLNPKAKYIGLDVSKKALSAASAKLPKAEFQLIEDGGCFPLKSASVDFIFASEVVEHIYDTENAFSEIARVLRPNGGVLLTTPYHGIIKNLLTVLLAFDSHFDPEGPHIRFFSKNSLFSCLRKAGLEPVEHGYYGRFYPVPHSIFVLAKKS
ncbi:MAG: class I SAM-dependent methyltransferase [Candidatus Micrarchaeota archaeon]|nr:class I SAM-dependent methyltransferase [Candidatus Micrarchaeota archaeon]